MLLYLYANIVRVLRQGALNTFIDLNIQARSCPRVNTRVHKLSTHSDLLRILNYGGGVTLKCLRMDGQGSKDEDSNSNVEVPQDNVPAQAAGDANPEADPERVDPGTAGLVNMEDPRDNTNADGQSTDTANDPNADADGQAQALSEGDDEESDASYEHEDDVWVTPVTTGFNVSKGFNITRSQRKRMMRKRREAKKVKSPSRALYEKRFITGPQATAARLAARQARAAALPMDQALPTRPTGARPKVPQPAQAAAPPPQAPAAATQEEQQPQLATGGLAPTEEDVAPVIGAEEPAQGRPPPTQAVIDAEKRRLEAIRKDKAEMQAERRRLDEISRKDKVEARQIHFDQMLEALKFIRKMHELVSDSSKREANHRSREDRMGKAEAHGGT